LRLAGAADLDACVEMGRRFHATSGLQNFIGFDEASFRNALLKLLDVRGLLVEGEPPFAMAGVFAAPSFFNAGALMAGEMFWWCEPEHRGQADLHALEACARGMGAKVMHMSCLEALRPEAVGKLYERAGYKPVDHLYYKRL
jgi:hypothetical protein